MALIEFTYKSEGIALDGDGLTVDVTNVVGTECGVHIQGLTPAYLRGVLEAYDKVTKAKPARAPRKSAESRLAARALGTAVGE
jgi:hypothetical protein